MTENQSPPMPSDSRPASHFQRLYDANPDPWGFETSPYEQAKYRHTVDTLGGRRFTSALEVGCSIGILTGLLASNCDRILGVDIIEEPLATARSRCAAQPHVSFARMRVPAEWPKDRFDLIVFSEVLYFLSTADIERTAQRVRETILPGATIILVNWLGQTDDPSPADAGPDCFIKDTNGILRVVRQERLERYRLDLLQAP